MVYGQAKAIDKVYKYIQSNNPAYLHPCAIDSRRRRILGVQRIEDSQVIRAVSPLATIAAMSGGNGHAPAELLAPISRSNPKSTRP
jgi:hypothetical protein